MDNDTRDELGRLLILGGVIMAVLVVISMWLSFRVIDLKAKVARIEQRLENRLHTPTAAPVWRFGVSSYREATTGPRPLTRAPGR